MTGLLIIVTRLDARSVRVLIGTEKRRDRMPALTFVVGYASMWLVLTGRDLIRAQDKRGIVSIIIGIALLSLYIIHIW